MEKIKYSSPELAVVEIEVEDSILYPKSLPPMPGH